LVVRYRQLELEHVGRNGGERLRRYAIPLRRVTVARERRSGVSALPRGEHDRPADALRERLLEDASIYDLDGNAAVLSHRDLQATSGSLRRPRGCARRTRRAPLRRRGA